MGLKNALLTITCLQCFESKAAYSMKAWSPAACAVELDHVVYRWHSVDSMMECYGLDYADSTACRHEKHVAEQPLLNT